MDASASAYLRQLTASSREVLGESLVGVYPHGSLLLGGWRPESSDIDVLVVVSRPLTTQEQGRLASAWSEESLPCPAIGLELSVVLNSTLAHPVTRTPFELHVTTAPQDSKIVDGHGHPGDFDLVLHLAVCHALGHPGFPPVPHDLVMAQLDRELEWAAQEVPTAYAVLNACRAWRYEVDGSLVSKVDGGRWAELRLHGAERTLVRTATDLQAGDSLEPVDPAAAHAFALRLRDVIRSGRQDDQNV